MAAMSNCVKSHSILPHLRRNPLKFNELFEHMKQTHPKASIDENTIFVY